MFSYEIGVLITYAGVVVLIFVFGKLFKWPLKIMGKFLASSLLGAAGIILFNFLGAGMGWMIPLNVVTAATVGLLGVPGALLLLILSIL